MTTTEFALIKRALVELPNVTDQEIVDEAGHPMSWEEAAATRIQLKMALEAALATRRMNRLTRLFLNRAKKKGIV
jgi:hypothetical protein